MNLSQWNETLEETSEDLIRAFEDHVWAKKNLQSFESNVRKHGYSKLIGASNSQKMNLEFEHLIAQDNENWVHWQNLQNKVVNTEADLFSAQKRHDVNIELARLVQSGRV